MPITNQQTILWHADLFLGNDCVMIPGGVQNRVPARGVIPIEPTSRINKIPFSLLTKQHTITFIYIIGKIT
jgi:hypothetical protein